MTGFKSSRVVLEVGTHSPWVSRLAERAGHEVIVANPRRVRLIAENDSKTDDVDAELLARLGRVDPGLLKPIVHRGKRAQHDRILLLARDGLVRSRTQLVNKLRRPHS
jgi:transposase